MEPDRRWWCAQRSRCSYQQLQHKSAQSQKTPRSPNNKRIIIKHIYSRVFHSEWIMFCNTDMSQLFVWSLHVVWQSFPATEHSMRLLTVSRADVNVVQNQTWRGLRSNRNSVRYPSWLLNASKKTTTTTTNQGEWCQQEMLPVTCQISVLVSLLFYNVQAAVKPLSFF